MNTGNTAHALVTFLLAGATLAGATSCCDVGCRGRNDSDLFLYSVPSATSPATEPGKAEEDGEPVVLRETCSLDFDGNFTLERTTRRLVAAIGATVATLEKAAAERRGVQPFSGVLVLTAREDGPAGRAGVRVDDIITGIGGKPVTSREQFEYLIDSARPGDAVEVRVLRKGQEVAIEVELGSETVTQTSQPIATRLPVLDDRARAGMRLAEVTADVAPYLLGTDSGPGGLLVLENVPGGPGFRADIRILDCIVEIDAAPVESVDAYSSALESLAAGDSVTLVVLRDGRKIEKRLRLVEDATAKWGFNALGLVKYRRAAGHWRFSLLWGLLFNASGHACIQKRPDYPQNSEEGCWGVVLDLIAWHSTPRKKELRLLWLFPIGVRSD